MLVKPYSSCLIDGFQLTVYLAAKSSRAKASSSWSSRNTAVSPLPSVARERIHESARSGWLSPVECERGYRLRDEGDWETVKSCRTCTCWSALHHNFLPDLLCGQVRYLWQMIWGDAVFGLFLLPVVWASTSKNPVEAKLILNPSPCNDSLPLRRIFKALFTLYALQVR